MSANASQAAEFYRQVAETGIMWTLRDKAGYPAPKTSSGKRAVPFWSSKSRVESIIANVPAYKGFWPEKVTYNRFIHHWVETLSRSAQLVGVNWSGKRATGYDLPAEFVERSIEIEKQNLRSI